MGAHARRAASLGAIALIVAGAVVMPGVGAEAAPASAVRHQVRTGVAVHPGERVTSRNGRFTVTVQMDGNVVERRGERLLWSSHTATDASSARGTRFRLTRSGAFVITRGARNVIWQSVPVLGRATSFGLNDHGQFVVSSPRGSRVVSAMVAASTVTTVPRPTPAPVSAPLPSAAPSAEMSVPVPAASVLTDPVPSASALPDPVPSASALPDPVPSASALPDPVPSASALPDPVPTVSDPVAPTASADPTAAPAPTVTSVPTVAPVAGVAGYALTTSYAGGGTAVNIRSAPSTSASIVTVRSPGTAISIVCQTQGDRFGSGSYADNRTWDLLASPDANAYVHDVLTTTPGGARTNLADGGYVAYSSTIPRCTGAPAPAAAATAAPDLSNGYPDGDAVDCSATYGKYSWCKNGSEWSSRKFAYRNCTDYVAWARGLVWGDVQAGGDGNARAWKQGWLNRGRQVSGTPRVGAIAWWGTEVGYGYGHVAIVTAVNADGSVQVKQYNGSGTGTFTVTQSTRADAYLY